MSRHANPPVFTWLIAGLACVCTPHALARSSDRDKPMDITAGQQQGSLDDKTPTVLSGGVTIDQGTLSVQAGRAVITSRGGEIARVVFTGGPAKLKQQLDDGTPMSAVANQVDYDVKREVVVFTGNVSIQQPRGTLSGQRVAYNMKTGQVNSGGEGAGRVKMRINPKKASKPDDSAQGGG